MSRTSTITRQARGGPGAARNATLRLGKHKAARVGAACAIGLDAVTTIGVQALPLGRSETLRVGQDPARAARIAARSDRIAGALTHALLVFKKQTVQVRARRGLQHCATSPRQAAGAGPGIQQAVDVAA